MHSRPKRRCRCGCSEDRKRGSQAPRCGPPDADSSFSGRRRDRRRRVPAAPKPAEPRTILRSTPTVFSLCARKPPFSSTPLPVTNLRVGWETCRPSRSSGSPAALSTRLWAFVRTWRRHGAPSYARTVRGDPCPDQSMANAAWASFSRSRYSTSSTVTTTPWISPLLNRPGVWYSPLTASPLS